MNPPEASHHGDIARTSIAHAIGVVVIGRNEGANLGKCFESLAGFGMKVVYVDSDSTDRSLDIAKASCEKAHALDASRPLSAARARNEGFDELLKLDPDIELVQFLDGDCTLLPGWPEAALEAFARRESLSVAIGHLIERHPDSSVYNRLCSLEWRSPPGDLSNHGALGGIMAVRADVFRKLGGFNSQVIAGEDSEFGVRIALAGGIVAKIDAQMATHDANILRFGQWWKRSVRAGHAIGQRSFLNGATPVRDCVHERNSTLFWGLGVPLSIIPLALIHPMLPLLVVVAYAWLFAKIRSFRHRAGDTPAESRIYATFTVIAKIANGFGLIRFYWKRRSGAFRIIEYK
jgi:GT2 family glycosyltransferase